ncbi:MAG TPA: wax ester/triacylglycerol synthase family O-acyltransferase [Candidatus Limnocylindrales bacterium]|nr:wax ester/triacylglycerol synthase family O-acyltransferase [Candidatus Limnocylindrales bacterium]
MPRYAYDRLSFLDNSFLIMERENTPMHIAGTATFDAAALTKEDGGIDIDRIRSYVESRLHLIPRYRQRLQQSWFLSAPIWVDYDHFNIHYHVRHTALPKPGDERQLKRLSARIMSQHLDRARPLWEIWIVEGLDDGARFAMVSKVHHCMVDGVSSVDLMNVLLTPFPIEEFEPAPRYVPRPAPSELDLLMETAGGILRLPLDVGSKITDLATQAGDPRSDVRARLRALRGMVGEIVGTSLRNADTPLNQNVGPHRRFDWLAMELDAIKAVKNRLGGTVNDVVLATVAGALRRFLERRRFSCEGIDFRVMAPVSVRAQDERGALGNRVSAWIVPMPLTERDPRRRLQVIRETTSHLKEAKQAMGAEVLAQVAEWTPSTILSLAAGMATRALPFNLVVTNVPGPQVPLYMLGARMRDNHGFVPLLDGLCLGIVLFSYAGQLFWGLTADWDLIPDLHDFVEDIEESFAELRQAAGTIEVRDGAGVEAGDGAAPATTAPETNGSETATVTGTTAAGKAAVIPGSAESESRMQNAVAAAARKAAEAAAQAKGGAGRTAGGAGAASPGLGVAPARAGGEAHGAAQAHAAWQPERPLPVQEEKAAKPAPALKASVKRVSPKPKAVARKAKPGPSSSTTKRSSGRKRPSGANGSDFQTQH